MNYIKDKELNEAKTFKEVISIINKGTLNSTSEELVAQQTFNSVMFEFFHNSFQADIEAEINFLKKSGAIFDFEKSLEIVNILLENLIKQK